MGTAIPRLGGREQALESPQYLPINHAPVCRDVTDHRAPSEARLQCVQLVKQEEMGPWGSGPDPVQPCPRKVGQAPGPCVLERVGPAILQLPGLLPPKPPS